MTANDAAYYRLRDYLKEHYPDSSLSFVSGTHEFIVTMHMATDLGIGASVQVTDIDAAKVLVKAFDVVDECIYGDR